MLLYLRVNLLEKVFCKVREQVWSNFFIAFVRSFIFLRGNIKYPFGISSKKDKQSSHLIINTQTHYIFDLKKDKQGVLSHITNRLAKYKISVKRIIQTPDKKNKKATIVIITHKTTEINAKKCLSNFKNNNNIIKFPTLIRLYN